jgi:membrane protein
MRIIALATRGFLEDECQLRASALTFYSLLSVVPVVALVFGIAKGFGLEEMLRRQIVSQQGWQASVSSLIINFATSFLEQARGSIIAGVGVPVLLWTVISVMGNIEQSFNDIWEIRESRTLFRQFTDYLSMVLVGTILLAVASSMTITVSSEIKAIGDRIALLGTVTPFILFLLQFIPYVIIWLLFSFAYIFMPNTPVDNGAGITGGIIAGTVFQVAQLVYIKFQVGVSSYGAIYGSFAALPLFLAWLQVSWMIVLFGAEISYAAENDETYGYHPDYSKLSGRVRMLLLLRIAHFIVKRFFREEALPTGKDIAAQLQIPERLVHQDIYKLIDADLVVTVQLAGSKEAAYQPKCAVDRFTIAFVIEAIENSGSNALPPGPLINEPVAFADSLGKLESSLHEFGDMVRRSNANLLLKDL